MSTTTPPLLTLPRPLTLSVVRDSGQLWASLGARTDSSWWYGNSMMAFRLTSFDDGESSAPFPVTNGVKQSCVLVPTLFSMMFSAMLTNAFHDSDSGIDIRYRTDGKLFSLWRHEAKRPRSTLTDFESSYSLMTVHWMLETNCPHNAASITAPLSWSDERLPKRILYGELQAGARFHGSQKKRFRDTLKVSMKDFNIDPASWETLAQDRPAWHCAVSRGATTYGQRLNCPTSANSIVLPPLLQNLPSKDRPHQPLPNPQGPVHGWRWRWSSSPLKDEHHYYCSQPFLPINGFKTHFNLQKPTLTKVKHTQSWVKPSLVFTGMMFSLFFFCFSEFVCHWQWWPSES